MRNTLDMMRESKVVIEGLLSIAQVLVPDLYYPYDTRILRAGNFLTELNQSIRIAEKETQKWEDKNVPS